MLLAALLALAAPAAAERPQPCTRANSVPATIERVLTERARFLHRCVAVTALYRAGALVTSVETLYLPGISWRGDPDENPADRQLIILDNDRLLRRLPRDGLYRATAYGRVQDCEEIRQAVQARAGPDQIVMTMGLCHYLPGLYLRAQDVRIGAAIPAVRLTGEANRARLGDLIAPPAGWRHRALVEDHVARYLAALRGGDRQVFAALHLPAQEPRRAREAADLAFGNHRGFADIRRSTHLPQMALFVQDAPGPPTSAERDRAHVAYAATACFCRTGDCAGRWPISEMDADNSEDRPYVCARFGPYVVNGRNVPYFSTERMTGGLPEPTSNSSTR